MATGYILEINICVLGLWVYVTSLSLTALGIGGGICMYAPEWIYQRVHVVKGVVPVSPPHIYHRSAELSARYCQRIPNIALSPLFYVATTSITGF